MNNALAKIVDFVEGRLPPAELEQLLYHDPDTQNLLSNDTMRVPGLENRHESTYLYVVQLQFDSPGDWLNAHAALTQFLERRGVSCQPTTKYSSLFDIILKAQPRWLLAPDNWIMKHVMPDAGDLQGKELKEWLTKRLLELFKYNRKPPKWIQNPAWPIIDDRPLVFLGQLRIDDYFHDEASAFVFHDPVTGKCETVVQVY